MTADDLPAIPLPDAGEGQEKGHAEPRPTGPVVPPVARRQAFRDIRREMTDEELSSPGVQKLVLDELERADAECEDLRGYVARFYDADKRASILEERLRTVTAIEIAFAVGVGLGGTILGLAPSLWDNQLRGVLAVVVGGGLILGGIAVRVVRR